MSAQDKYDWDELFYRICQAVEMEEVLPQWTTIAKHMGIAYSTLRNGLARYAGIENVQDLRNIVQIAKDRNIGAAREAAVKFVDVKEGEDINWREFVDLAKTNQDFEERLSPRQKFATITIETEVPIGIMFTSDWHLGERYTDHDQWARDIEFLLEAPNLYMVDLGDDRQNMRSFKVLARILSQVLSPKQQALMMRSVVEELCRSQKLLAKVAGNHDREFDERIFGEALQKYLYGYMTAPFFNNRGLLKLTVGSTFYTIMLFHKSRFKSFLRRTHGAMREHQLSVPADIVAGGHDHAPGLEHLYHYTLAKEAGLGFGGETLLIKTGTYSDGTYGWKYFHSGGFSQNYTVVLYPHQHKMVAFTNPEDAMQYMAQFPILQPSVREQSRSGNNGAE